MPSSPEPYGLRIAEPGDTLVVGLGNPILGDDGVGWRVIDELDELEHDDASLQQACVGGVSLMELLVGYRRAIIVDAIIDPEDATRQRLVQATVGSGDSGRQPPGLDARRPTCRPPSKQAEPWGPICRLTSRSWASSSSVVMSSAKS